MDAQQNAKEQEDDADWLVDRRALGAFPHTPRLPLFSAKFSLLLLLLPFIGE